MWDNRVRGSISHYLTAKRPHWQPQGQDHTDDCPDTQRMAGAEPRPPSEDLGFSAPTRPAYPQPALAANDDKDTY